jgi:tetratricopeptide (TPR) repeat protein
VVGTGHVSREPRWRALPLAGGVGLAVAGAALAYVLAGGPWAVAGAVIGAATGSFAPSVYDVIRRRDAAREGLRDTFEKSPAQSGARLLDPHRELVGFVGRTDELRALTAWCGCDDTDRLRLVTGPGGVGKTRLAVELSERMKTRGWACERIADGQESAAIAALRAVSRARALLVVDYAETRVGLRQMLTALAGDQGAGVRVLLLARDAGDWWDQLGAGGPSAWDLVQAASSAHLRLSPVVAADLSDADVIALAVRSFAQELGLPERTVEIYGDVGTGQRRVLDLHAAALVAVLAEAQGGTVRVDIRTVLGELLRHEQHFWYDSARTYGLSGGRDGTTAQALRQIVAAGCLLGAASQEEARVLPARVPGMSASATIAEWLRLLYPPDPGGSDWIGSMQPDRLAELHTLREFIASPQLAQACLTNLNARQGIRAVALLARASSDYPEAENLLSRILPNVAGFPADMEAPAEILTAILNAIPYPTVVLAPAAVSLGQRITSTLPTGTDPGVRAYWLSSLGNRLSELGRHTEALPVIEEAITIRRALAAVEPSRYRADLTNSLVNVGVALAELGRLPEALAADGEAVAIRRELAAADPDRYRPDLAFALTNLAQRLFAMARSAQALQATEEAAAIYQELAAADPGRYRADLAISLDALGIRFSALGRYAEALPVTEQAAAIHRELAAADPDRYRPYLAQSLGNLGVSLSEMGRSAEALPVTEEALVIRRELAAASPDRWRPELATTLDNLSSQLSELGHFAEALPFIEEALIIHQDLAAAGSDRWRPDLATTLDTLGTILLELDRPAEALAAGQEAMTIYRELAATEPDRHQPGLARSLANLGAVLVTLDLAAEALQATEDAAAIYRELTAANPGRYRPNLASALSSITAIQSELDHLAEAARAIEEALTISRELAAADPDRYRPGLASALVRHGVVLSDLDRPGDALAAEQEALTLYRELTAASPDNYRPALAMSLDHLGVTLVELGRPAEALAAGHEAVTIYRELAAASPDLYRPDLARSLGNLAQPMKLLSQDDDAAAALGESAKLHAQLSR